MKKSNIRKNKDKEIKRILRTPKRFLSVNEWIKKEKIIRKNEPEKDSK